MREAFSEFRPAFSPISREAERIVRVFPPCVRDAESKSDPVRIETITLTGETMRLGFQC